MKKNVLSKTVRFLEKRNCRTMTQLFLLAFVFFVSNISYGQDATSLDFDGANDYVSCGNIMPSTYTKEAWFLVSNLSLNNNLISGGSVDGQHALYPGAVNGNRLSAGHNGTWNAVQDPTPIVANTWYHVALTYDAATTTMKLYTNGVLVSTNTNVAPFTGGNALRIGAFDNGNNLLGGKMDEVRIWNRVLTQTEIQSNMYCELASGQTGLLAYYKFNQGVAAGTNTGINTLTDSSGNNNTGTLINFGLTGTTSNWTADTVAKSSAETVTASCSYLWTENGSVYTASGTFTNTVNCFTKTLNLTITPIDLPIINSQFRQTDATIADITVLGGQNIKWYADTTSQDVLASDTTLETKTYYATQTQTSIDGVVCESERLPVNITVGDAPDGYTYIADSRFEQKLIDLGYDDVIDSLVLTDNISSVTDLNLGGAGIKDLTGIEAFSSLVTLDLIYNNIKNLQLVGLTQLETVGAYGSYVETVDFAGSTNIKNLNLGNSNISEIYLQDLTQLENLEISGPITNLDLTGLTNLTTLNCRYTQITSLDLRNKPNLTVMNASQVATLSCIIVDDIDNANGKTYEGGWEKDATANYNLGTTNTTTASTCEEYYTWAVNGATYYSPGTYTFLNGCTIETLELEFIARTINSTSINECASYTWAESGETYTKSGVYTVLKKDCITEELILTIKMPALQTTTYTLCGPATADNLFVSQSNGSVNFYTTETGSDRVTGAIAEGTHTFYVSQTEMQFNWKTSKNNKAALCESVRVPIEYIVRPTIDNTVVFENGTITVATVVSGDTYRWYDVVANEDVAGETNSSFTPAVAGTYKVYIRRNAETPGDYCWRASEEINTTALSNTNFDAATGLSVYPNPSFDVFFINTTQNGAAVVFDVLGKAIQSQKIISGTTKLDLSHASKGVYLLKITNDKNESKTMKLIKK